MKSKLFYCMKIDLTHSLNEVALPPLCTSFHEVTISFPYAPNYKAKSPCRVTSEDPHVFQHGPGCWLCPNSQQCLFDLSPMDGRGRPYLVAMKWLIQIDPTHTSPEAMRSLTTLLPSHTYSLAATTLSLSTICFPHVRDSPD